MTTSETPTTPNPVAAHTAAIVCAYVGNNPVSPDRLSALIADVANAVRLLCANTASATGPEAAPAELRPAVPIRKSITPDAIICLEDGKAFKSLKRHLSSTFGLTPEQYRAKWGLPDDYPMVAPNYSATRSSLAKANGLGRKAMN